MRPLLLVVSLSLIGCPIGRRADVNGDGRVDMADVLFA